MSDKVPVDPEEGPIGENEDWEPKKPKLPNIPPEYLDPKKPKPYIDPKAPED